MNFDHLFIFDLLSDLLYILLNDLHINLRIILKFNLYILKLHLFFFFLFFLLAIIIIKWHIRCSLSRHLWYLLNIQHVFDIRTNCHFFDVFSLAKVFFCLFLLCILAGNKGYVIALLGVQIPFCVIIRWTFFLIVFTSFVLIKSIFINWWR